MKNSWEFVVLWWVLFLAVALLPVWSSRPVWMRTDRQPTVLRIISRWSLSICGFAVVLYLAIYALWYASPHLDSESVVVEGIAFSIMALWSFGWILILIGLAVCSLVAFMGLLSGSFRNWAEVIPFLAMHLLLISVTAYAVYRETPSG